VTWQRISLPSEGAKPPEEERVATLVSTEGPTSYRLVGVAASDPAAGSNPSPAHFPPSRLSNTYWHDLGMKPKCAMIPGSFLRADSRGRRPGVAPHQTVRAISNSPRSDAIAVARASTVASTVVAEFHICYLVR